MGLVTAARIHKQLIIAIQVHLYCSLLRTWIDLYLIHIVHPDRLARCLVIPYVALLRPIERIRPLASIYGHGYIW